MDATTDDLAFVKDDRWTRVRADTGAVEEIAGEEEVPVAASPAEGEAPTR